ncbi:hypothetical protein [Flavobacterium panacagri]|uniref:hypothetical protein n=1 Tax=Flavobacterium panacagri TaxID=3034146 RepID=UPI0025A635F2|nr:hypothetical protein [Flavobacterium panacagri]
MTTAEIDEIKDNIADVLNRHANITPARTLSLLNITDLTGKLYEASVLAEVIERLAVDENLTVTLAGTGTFLHLKQKGGPINRNYPYFEISQGGRPVAELFTDIYFSTISRSRRANTLIKQRGDYHELDIALIATGVQIRPEPEEILIAIECKNTTLEKSTIRELLGFRRELSFVGYAEPTTFTNWPAPAINADPPSIHMLYTTHGSILQHYRESCEAFGIKLIHHSL